MLKKNCKSYRFFLFRDEKTILNRFFGQLFRLFPMFRSNPFCRAASRSSALDRELLWRWSVPRLRLEGPGQRLASHYFENVAHIKLILAQASQRSIQFYEESLLAGTVMKNKLLRGQKEKRKQSSNRQDSNPRLQSNKAFAQPLCSTTAPMTVQLKELIKRNLFIYFLVLRLGRKLSFKWRHEKNPNVKSPNEKSLKLKTCPDCPTAGVEPRPTTGVRY